MKTKKSKSRKAGAPRRGRVLPDDACVSCGTIMKERCASLTTSVNGEKISVPETHHLKCPKCGDIMFRLNEMRFLHHTANEIYRKKYGLLSSDDIRSLREHLGLTQPELGRLLRLDRDDTIARWEAGRMVQTAALDVFLRLIRDLPGSVAYLRDHAA